jgi:hypothetical protein
MKITAVFVEQIESSLAFWVERRRFQKTGEVPEENHLGFVILVRDGAELVMQTLSSARQTSPASRPTLSNPRAAASSSKSTTSKTRNAASPAIPSSCPSG